MWVLAVPWVLAAVLFAWVVLYRWWPRRIYRDYATYLEAPDSYWAAPPEIKKLLCNGAGPSGDGWLVPDTVYLVSITEAANIHDWMYVWGENLDDKDEADAAFLINCIRTCTEHTTRVPVARWVMLWFRHRRCLTYYEAVVDFGNRAFIAAHKARPPGWPPKPPEVFTTPDGRVIPVPDSCFTGKDDGVKTAGHADQCPLPPPGLDIKDDMESDAQN